MSLLLLFHPRATGTPTPTAVYGGRLPRRDDEKEIIDLILMSFPAIIEEENRR